MTSTEAVPYRDYKKVTDELLELRAENERLRAAIVDFEAALSRHHRGLKQRCAVCETRGSTY